MLVHLVKCGYLSSFEAFSAESLFLKVFSGFNGSLPLRRSRCSGHLGRKFADFRYCFVVKLYLRTLCLYLEGMSSGFWSKIERSLELNCYETLGSHQAAIVTWVHQSRQALTQV